MTVPSARAGHSRSPAARAVFRPVRAGNAFEETVERLLQAIKLGVAAPGEQLPPERELAMMFNVSRVTLREAIRDLTSAGYVEVRRGRYGGTFIRSHPPEGGSAVRTPPAAREIEDILLLRTVLEVGSAEAAASAALTQRERAHLRDRLDACSSAPLADYRRMDSRFHLALAEVTGSASLTAAVADERTRVNELLDAIPLLEHNIAHSNAQHEQLVDAVLHGDATKARAVMTEHLDGTAALLRGFLV